MSNDNLQLFAIGAENRSDASDRPTFLVEAESHREAWRIARETCRTGRGAKVRDLYNADQLHDLPLTAGLYTVKRVLSASGSRRGRPPKLLTTDLLAAAESRHVAVPPRVRKVIEQLMTAA